MGRGPKCERHYWSNKVVLMSSASIVSTASTLNAIDGRLDGFLSRLRIGGHLRFQFSL